MSQFADSDGRTWSVRLSVATLSDMASEGVIKATDLLSEQGLSQMASDLVMLGDVLWVVCREQATARGVTRRDFLGGLSGDALVHAFHAMTDAIVAFQPDQRRRQVLASAVKVAREVESQELDRMTAEAERLQSPEATAELLAQLRPSSGTRSGDVLESAELTPDR